VFNRGEYFLPDDDTLVLISGGYLSHGYVDTCDDCWDKLNQSPDDLIDINRDADPGLL
jgi:hypothetical protein